MPNSPDDISVVKEEEVDTFSGKDRLERERRPALVFLRGELLAVPIPLDRKEVTLGRALEADVRVSDSRASRLHARITTEPGEENASTRYRLTDLDSTNGTILNVTPIDDAFLQDADKLEIGVQLFAFEMLDEMHRQFLHQIHRLLFRN